MSKIATQTAATAMAFFAGQTVTIDTVYEFIEQQYAMARRRTGISSFFQVTDACVAAGATLRGDAYTFPAAA